MIYRVNVAEEHYIRGELTTEHRAISSQDYGQLSTALLVIAAVVAGYETQHCHLESISSTFRGGVFRLTRDSAHPTLIEAQITLTTLLIPMERLHEPQPVVTDHRRGSVRTDLLAG